MSQQVSRKGKAWAVVCNMKGEGVHKVETTPARIDRVVMGMLTNMNREAYYVDEWYEFPEKGEKDKDGKAS